ncbi:MAG: entericidin A/B family lipoprotein [Pseudomonadota bacterium]
MNFAKSALAGLLALPLLAACNTIEGVGQDVQAVGAGVTSAAQFMERELFGPQPRQTRTAQADSRNISYRNPQVSVGQACDPGGELAGGSSLPPCRSQIVRPTPRNY